MHLGDFLEGTIQETGLVMGQSGGTFPRRSCSNGIGSAYDLGERRSGGHGGRELAPGSVDAATSLPAATPRRPSPRRQHRPPSGRSRH